MLGFFRKKDKQASMCSVKIAPWNTVLELKSGANLLDAAIAQGLPVPYNCRVGACKTCQVRVLEGQPKSLLEREYVFNREEIAAGMYLACQTRVESDLYIDWPQLTATTSTQAQVAYLLKIEKMTSRIHRVQLRLSSAVDWHAGQFAKLLPDGLTLEPRCYSMVHDGQDASLMTFDITLYPGGAVSSWLVNTDNLGKPVKVEAPFGEFGQQLSHEHAEHPPLLCIAGGSGVGSIGGIIASHAKKQSANFSANLSANTADSSVPTPVVLVVGARERSEIYGLNELRELAQKIQLPLYIDVVLDREPETSLWGGRRGYVADHLQQILADAARHDTKFQQPHDAWRVLLCGPPPMVDSSIDRLKQYGLNTRQMAFDKYEQVVS